MGFLKILFAGLLGLGACTPPLAFAQLSASQPDPTTQALHDVMARRHYAQALIWAAAGKSSAAGAEFRAAWELDPDDEKYAHGLTEFYIHSHQFDKALGLLKDYVSRHGATALGYRLQGELLFERGQYDLAGQSAYRALELSHNQDYRAHELLGLIDIVRQKYIEALEELRIAVRQEPESAQVRYFYGRMCYINGHYEEARDQFMACLKLQPSYPKALENLGLCYEALGDYPKAIDVYRQAIDLDRAGKTPPSDDPYVDYGVFLAAHGRPDQAIGILKQGLERNPDSARANFELGRVIFETEKDYEQAEGLLLRSAALDLDFSRPHYFLGRLYQKEGRASEAKSQFAVFEKLNEAPQNRQARVTGRPLELPASSESPAPVSHSGSAAPVRR